MCIFHKLERLFLNLIIFCYLFFFRESRRGEKRERARRRIIGKKGSQRVRACWDLNNGNNDRYVTRGHSYPAARCVYIYILKEYRRIFRVIALRAR